MDDFQLTLMLRSNVITIMLEGINIIAMVQALLVVSHQEPGIGTLLIVKVFIILSF